MLDWVHYFVHRYGQMFFALAICMVATYFAAWYFGVMIAAALGILAALGIVRFYARTS